MCICPNMKEMSPCYTSHWILGHIFHILSHFHGLWLQSNETIYHRILIYMAGIPVRLHIKRNNGGRWDTLE